MKRIIFSCFLILSFLLISNKANAQVPAFDVNPQAQCAAGLSAWTASAVITVTTPGASSYSWSVASPTVAPGPCQAAAVNPAANGLSVTLQFSCCGVYTAVCLPYSSAGIPLTGLILTRTVEIVCGGGGTLVSSNTNTTSVAGTSAVCAGNAVGLTLLGSSPFVSTTLTTKPANAVATTSTVSNPFNLTPSVNTTFTMVGTTAIGCTVAGTHTVLVQSATIAASPTLATRCPGQPVTLTSTFAAVTNTSVAPGTVTNSINWFDPGTYPTGPPIANTANTITGAQAGLYTAALVHTGVAGSCTRLATVQINTVGTVTVAITPSVTSVCPGNLVTLVATSPQTAGINYTWTPNGPAPISVNGRTLTDNPNVASVYTVDVTYYGCTGTQTASVGMSTITPILTVSTPSSCPNRSLLLTASGGVNYTFTAFWGPSLTLGSPGSPTSTTRVHSPSLFQLQSPIVYSVNASQNGCIGSASVQVGLLALNTILTSSISAPSGSACPNTSVTLSTNNGATTTHTFGSLTFGSTQTSTTTGGGPNTSAVVFPTGFLNLCHTFTVGTDSAGCKGNSSIVICSLNIVPTITTVPASGSICPGSTISLISSGGAGTSYTFSSPYAPTTMPKASATVNAIYNHTVPLLPGLPYQYTVNVDSAGCVGSSIVDINLWTIYPTISLSSASICPNSQFTVVTSGGSGSTYTFTESSSLVSTSTVINTGTSTASGGYTLQTTPSSTINLGDAYTYTVEIDSAGCKGDGTFTVGILDLSTLLTLSVKNNSTNLICPGSFTLEADSGSTNDGLTTYTFYSLPSLTMLQTGTNNLVPQTTPTLPVSFLVQAKKGSCTGSQTVTIGEYTLTGLAISASPTLVCAGMPVTLTASGVGGTVPTSVNYVFISANGASTTPTLMASTSRTISTGSYTNNPYVQTFYSVQADSSGCKSPTTIPFVPTTTVDIRPAITLTPSSSQASVCPGLTTSLSVVGSVSNFTVTWSPQLATQWGTLIPGPNPYTTAIASPTTNVTYTIDAIDALGCTGQTVITIGIDPNAALSVTAAASSDTVCPGLTTTLTASSSINPVTFTWSAVSGGLGATTGSQVTAAPVGLGTVVYTVVADNGYGCYGYDTHTITVTNYPSPTILPTSNAVCTGYTSTLTAFGANSYTWTGTTFTGAVAQQSISVLPGNYTVLASNGGGCTNIATQSITLAPPLNIIVSPINATTCIESNGNSTTGKLSKPINLSASGAGTYVWSPYNPYYMTYSLGPSTTVKPPATTQYTIVGSTAVCSGSTIVSVIVIPQFTMNVIPPTPKMCLGDSLKLSIVNIGPGAVGPASAYSYSWTEQDNTEITIVGSKLTSTVVILPISDRTYYGEVKDSRGCASLPGIASVTVLPKPLTAVSIPTISGVPTNTICYVGSQPGPPDIILNLTGVNQNLNLPFGVVPTYTWLSPTKRVSILTPQNSPQITISAPERTPSVIIYTLNSGYNGIPGCAEFDTVSIRVVDCRAVGTVTFTTDNGGGSKGDTICARSCVTFINLNDTASGGPQTYTWTFKGGSPPISHELHPTVCYNLPGPHDVFLTVRNPYPKALGGSATATGVTSYIRVVDIPNVTIISPGQLRSDSTIRFGQEIKLTGSGAFTYSWFPDYNITSTTKPEVTINPNKTTQYILTGKNSMNCYSSDTLNVIVIEDCGEMYVPNAFTPNGDGSNDVLYVRGICLESLTFIVFNRWGEKVFETADQKVGWDGTYKGEILNTGAFVYRLEGRTYDGKSFTAKGNITLLR